MAVKSQNSLFQVSTAAGSPKTITAITAASPPVVTSTSHGLANGTLVVIAGVVGMTEVNGRAFVVANTATNTFELKGVDGTAYTTYASGGTATGQTLTAISEVTDFSGLDGEAAVIPTTHLRSPATEFQVGLKNVGNCKMSVNVISDAGQTKLRSLRSTAALGYFLVTHSDTTYTAFQAFVMSFTLEGINPDGVRKGSINLLCSLDASGDFS